MPRGEIKHLKKYKFKPHWKHQPTVRRSYPSSFIEELDAIAHWADEQDDPAAALRRLLDAQAVE